MIEKLLTKLDDIEHKWQEIGEQLMQPEILQDIKKYTRLHKQYRGLEEIVTTYRQYREVVGNMETNRAILKEESDPELKEMASEELDELQRRKAELEEQLKRLLVPQDPLDAKNAIVEIRAGTGGDEASLFAGDLFRMYQRFCEKNNLKVEVIEYHEGTTGGFKLMVFNVIGPGAYGLLKYEGGVHRVQRVPQTESQGRIHTSAASVVVMPEIEGVEVEIKDSDIKKEIFCASGPGGQSVNTTYSAVRLTHIPTGVVASCQDEKSQIKNLEKAMKVLKARVYEIERRKQQEAVASTRKETIKGGDRSVKIRTYNFPQGRVTDHRIGLTLYNLEDVLNGNLMPLIEPLRVAENAEKLKTLEA